MLVLAAQDSIQKQFFLFYAVCAVRGESEVKVVLGMTPILRTLCSAQRCFILVLTGLNLPWLHLPSLASPSIPRFHLIS